MPQSTYLSIRSLDKLVIIHYYLITYILIKYIFYVAKER